MASGSGAEGAEALPHLYPSEWAGIASHGQFSRG
jgi:hypothetical protein